MIDNSPHALYKVVINGFLFEFTVDSRARDTQLLYNTRDGNTAIFDGFLQNFTLMWHIYGIP